MGIINVTPDSFYAESRILNTDLAVARALELEELGADIVDIGGESTRPGSTSIDTDEEIRRVIPIVEGVRKRSNILISVDTSKPEVTARALDLGADIINDITGLGTSHLYSSHRGEPPDTQGDRETGGNHNHEEREETGTLIARSSAFVVLMHMRGTPFDMQNMAHYNDVAAEVSAELDIAVQRALHAGIHRDRIILDPGIGFAKTAEQNLQLLKNLHLLKAKGYPILVGLSRKSFLGVYTGREPEERLVPSVAANAISIFQGADIIRVHDVAEAVDTVRIVNAIMDPRTEGP